MNQNIILNLSSNRSFICHKLWISFTMFPQKKIIFFNDISLGPYGMHSGNFILTHAQIRYLFLFNIALCSYIIQNNVCYLCLADQQFSTKLAFKFLDDISGEFQNLYGNRVDEAMRPYHFIEFGWFGCGGLLIFIFIIFVQYDLSW